MSEGILPKCIGFGEYDNRRQDGPGCDHAANTPARLWCERCEALRHAAINAGLATIREMFRD